LTKHFDVVIMGSGMAGLVSANLLAMEGLSVCVLEKNKQIGGALQVYVRNRTIFDTGVHYLGGLAEGENLYQIFKYLGILEGLKVQRMSQVFDKIIIEGDDKEYNLMQGYDNFIASLVADFPSEAPAINEYCNMMQSICRKFALYNLQPGGLFSDKAEVMEIDTKAFLESITKDEKLQAVLAGNNVLYAGQPDKTPFYVHALVLNSYIESSWKCVGGGSQIAKLLSRMLHRRGGLVKVHAEVTRIIENDGKVSHVEMEDGSPIHAELFISNIHPARTLEMIDSPLIRNSYRNRLQNLENSLSCFTVDIVFKPGCFPALTSNYYYHKKGEIWSAGSYTAANWPLIYAIFPPVSVEKTEFARSINILTYMRYDEVKQWDNTFNTVSNEDNRGTEYENFKKNRAEILISLVEEKFPGLRECIQYYYTATPLSYRDYIGAPQGSMYGIVKDYKDPVKTMISPRTKLPNLYFTGQNLNMHGVLGAAMSALLTCSVVTGSEDFIDRIRNA
jgi:all-trans-retinol 13,14-reductase